jgi:hypothetical protein
MQKPELTADKKLANLKSIMAYLGWPVSNHNLMLLHRLDETLPVHDSIEMLPQPQSGIVLLAFKLENPICHACTNASLRLYKNPAVMTVFEWLHRVVLLPQRAPNIVNVIALGTALPNSIMQMVGLTSDSPRWPALLRASGIDNDVTGQVGYVLTQTMEGYTLGDFLDKEDVSHLNKNLVLFQVLFTLLMLNRLGLEYRGGVDDVVVDFNRNVLQEVAVVYVVSNACVVVAADKSIARLHRFDVSRIEPAILEREHEKEQQQQMYERMSARERRRFDIERKQKQQKHDREQSEQRDRVRNGNRNDSTHCKCNDERKHADPLKSVKAFHYKDMLRVLVGVKKSTSHTFTEPFQALLSNAFFAKIASVPSHQFDHVLDGMSVAAIHAQLGVTPIELLSNFANWNGLTTPHLTPKHSKRVKKVYTLPDSL